MRIAELKWKILLHWINHVFLFQIILAELEILTLISEKNTTWLSENIGVILGVCLCFASYGLSHHTESVPQYMLPTPLLNENQGDRSSVFPSVQTSW